MMDNKKMCLLCKTALADKKNSHIIPKFLCRGLFSKELKHTLSINSDGKEQKPQDTPKESHILCSNCEKRIEILETYFAPIIRDINNYSNLPSKFIHHRSGNQEFLECNDINPTLFKLFIYSLVWRTSISNLGAYQQFKLSKSVEEELRTFLDQCLSVNKAELLASIDKENLIPLYHNCIVKPKEVSTGILSAYKMSNEAYLIVLVDFAVLFYTDEESIGSILRPFSNKQNKKVLIAMGGITEWKELNKIVISRMLGGKRVLQS